MEVTRCYIERGDSQVLIDALQREASGIYTYDSDHIRILVTDKYFLRINSNLLTVIIVDFTSRFRINIEIISGGGGIGLLRFDWSSEGSANDKIMKIIRKTCELNSWNLFEN